MRNIYPQEHETDINRRKKALVQSLKQFHAHFYWLYKEGMTCAMVSLQGLHLGDALKCLCISASMGLKLFCPWCFKLGGNTEMIAILLCEVYYCMAIVCDICWVFASMTVQNIQDHPSVCKGKCDKECAECEAHEAHRKAQKSQDSKKESQSHKSKKHPSHRDRREHLSHSGQVSMDQPKMLPRNA